MEELPVCMMECEDCGKYAVVLKTAMSMFIVDDDIYAISRCAYCDRVIIDGDIADEVVDSLTQKRVRFFSWNTGEEIRALEDGWIKKFHGLHHPASGKELDTGTPL